MAHCGSLHILPPSISPSSTQTSKTPTRLSFTAGPRALRYLRQSSRQLSLAAQALGCGRTDLAERVGRSEELRKEGLDTQKGLRGELAKLVTANAISAYESAPEPKPAPKPEPEPQADGQAEAEVGAGSGSQKAKVVWVKRDEKATHDFEFLGSIAGGLTACPTATANETRVKPVVLVSSSLPGKDQTHLVLVQSNDQDRAKEVNEQVKAALDSLAGPEGGKRVKGGGAKGRYMSKVDGKWGKAEEAKIAEVVAAVRARLTHLHRVASS